MRKTADRAADRRAFSFRFDELPLRDEKLDRSTDRSTAVYKLENFPSFARILCLSLSLSSDKILYDLHVQPVPETFQYILLGQMKIFSVEREIIDRFTE